MATRRSNWALPISRAAWPVEVIRGHVAKLDSKRSKRRSAAGVELLAKAGCEPKRFVREIRGPVGELAVGGQVKVDALADVKAVDITGICKGRGFAGAIKRHKFSGQRATHGVKKCHRALGGTGASAFPSRVDQRQADAGPARQRHARPSAIRSW